MSDSKPIWQDNWLPPFFTRQHGRLYCEDVALDALTATFGTPCYVYSAAHLRAQVKALQTAFSEFTPQIHYAVKANDAHGLLLEIAQLGLGFDVVSGGELARALAAGATGRQIVFSGVGKTAAELESAIRAGVSSINIESRAEADLIRKVAARLDTNANVSIRINPDVDARTHPKIATGLSTSKFGMPVAEALDVYAHLQQDANINIVGLACHIGSQLLSIAPTLAAVDKVLEAVSQLESAGIELAQLDLGGGFGIQYGPDQSPLDVTELGRQLATKLAGFNGNIAFEPGRYIVGNAGVLCSEIIYAKSTESGTQLAVVDAAMNDLLRPALYDAEHQVVPLDVPESQTQDAPVVCDIVGPVCESSDVLARQVRLPGIQAGNQIAVLSTGAYGSVMAGTYNSRPRPVELMVDGDRVAVLRQRETIDDLLARDAHDLNWKVLS